MKELRVLAQADKLVLDVAYAARTGRLRFVGRKLSEHPSIDACPAGAAIRERDPVMPGDKYYVEAWSLKSEPTLIAFDKDSSEFFQYFVQMVKEGGLLPADAATAAFCGVAFGGVE